MGPERELEALGRGLRRLLALSRALLRLLQQGRWPQAAALVGRRGEMIQALGRSKLSGRPLSEAAGARAAEVEALRALVEELRRLDDDCRRALSSALAEVERRMALVRQARRAAAGYRAPLAPSHRPSRLLDGYR
ncbi:MAG: flagellar protein FliT [Acetobacteraceae bacterium]|nr:flagellar protein FliT [Acetobacteraceae bacterium]